MMKLLKNKTTGHDGTDQLITVLLPARLPRWEKIFWSRGFFLKRQFFLLEAPAVEINRYKRSVLKTSCSQFLSSFSLSSPVFNIKYLLTGVVNTGDERVWKRYKNDCIWSSNYQSLFTINSSKHQSIERPLVSFCFRGRLKFRLTVSRRVWWCTQEKIDQPMIEMIATSA